MPSALISTETLASWFTRPDVVVLDASWHMPAEGRNARAEYVAQHIPNARFFDIDTIADKTTNLPHMLPSQAEFEQAVGVLGISNNSTIVVYDSKGIFSAPRVWWEFRAYGHTNIFVLDGGLPKWLAEGREVASAAIPISPQTFQAKLNPHLIRNRAEVLAASQTRSSQILDARAEGRFNGKEPEPRVGLHSGHIPHSKNLFFKNLIAENGTLKPAQELQAICDAAGIDTQANTIASCGSGITACVLALALYELGNQNVAVYDGSWAEWGADTALPIEVCA